MQKYENVGNFPKIGPMEFIFGQELDLDKKTFSERLAEIIMTSS